MRNRLGHWCGYVGVQPGHPLHGKNSDEVQLSAHGDVNFAAGCAYANGEGFGVCHVPDPGEPDDRLSWFGFDCAHGFDVVPMLLTNGLDLGRDCEYRTLEYVTAECEYLAAQLAAIGAAP